MMILMLMLMLMMMASGRLGHARILPLRLKTNYVEHRSKIFSDIQILGHFNRPLYGAVSKPVPSQPFARRRPFRKRLQATDAFDCHPVPADLDSKQEMMDQEEQWQEM